ncbi:MAG: DUF2924 domain-containing protein [Pseudomonadota bacterium]
MGVHLSLAEKLKAIEHLSHEELKARWRKDHGVNPPKGVRRGILMRSAAWHLQAKSRGGLSRSAKTFVRQSIAQLRSEGPDSEDSDDRSGIVRRVRVRKAVTPGSRLIREWNGKTYAVDATDEGFLFEGQVFRSLSAVARHITGARWSGPRFFGL